MPKGGDLPLLAEIQASQKIAEAGRLVARGIAEDSKRCGLKREVIAERMSALLGVRIARHKIDAWASEGKSLYRIPAEYLAAWVRVTGGYEALRAVVKSCGCVLVVPEQVARELEVVQKKKREILERERTLKALKEVADEEAM